MSELKSMKLSKKDADARSEPSSLATEGPAYPWGLSFSFDDEVLKKLEMTAADFTVGKTMTLIAKIDVTSVSEQETKGSKPKGYVGLQITAMCLEDGASKAAAAAESLYGEEKE